MDYTKLNKIAVALVLSASLAGCGSINNGLRDLVDLTNQDPEVVTTELKAQRTIPGPLNGAVTIAVYQFRDLTGQRRASQTVATLSSAVTQGADAYLIRSLQTVGGGRWFKVVERGGLDNIIKEKCNENKKLDYSEVWSSIIANNGSVQHLEILDDWQKSVFKTAIEIDQRWVIEHAADRQAFIDQGQSVNIFFKPDANIKYLHAVHFLAWKKGLRTLYYCRSEKIIKADRVSQKIERNVIDEIDLKQLAEGVECLACEG